MKKTLAPLLSHYRFEGGQTVLFETHRHLPKPVRVFSMHLPAEVGVVLEGRVIRYTRRTAQELPRGGLWFNSTLEPHGWSRTVEGTRTAVFIVKPEFLFDLRLPGVPEPFWRAPFDTPPEERPLLVDEDFARWVEALVETIRDDRRSPQAVAAIEVTLLDVLLRATRTGRFKARPGGSGEGINQVLPALECLHQAGPPVSTAEAARHCGLPPVRFARLFARATGLSFSHYSLRYRLAEAAHELRTSPVLLDELAWKWGFCDKSHFAHRFHEYFHVTPGQYRKDTTL